jgi:uncharacterized protein (DUF2141 family)
VNQARLCGLTTAVLGLVLTCCGGAAQDTRTLSGSVSFEGDRSGPVVVDLYKLTVPSQGRVRRLTKEDILGGAEPFRALKLEAPGSYAFSGLPPGPYSVLAFMDRDGNGRLGFDPPEPFGWYTASPGGPWDPVDLTLADASGRDFELRAPTPFPRTGKAVEHGALVWKKGLPVLQLRGTAEERGFAHGYLVGRQIIDFFEFYIVEDNWQSAKDYRETFVPFLENRFRCPEEFLRECDAVIKGMRASGTDMGVDMLGRDFNRTDLLAINAYIEKRSASSVPVPGPSSCTQAAFWGPRTKGGGLDGGLVAARNMDGECDIRKVTVSHFLVFAVDPSEPGRRRWVSTMWPGFVGTISGVNEEGLYSMEDAGGSGPGPVPEGIVPCSWIQRYILEKQGREATPASVLEMMKPFASSTGGITAAGSIILWAVPYTGQAAPAFVYEGGRAGFAMRTPAEFRPADPATILASNHHLKYGADPAHPDVSLGSPVSFSSRWRYETAMQTLEAWSRRGRPLGVDEAVRLLQQVAHGTTEYAVIFKANERRLLVAVDDLAPDLWDAPYRDWAEFDFDELFKR